MVRPEQTGPDLRWYANSQYPTGSTLAGAMIIGRSVQFPPGTLLDQARLLGALRFILPACRLGRQSALPGSYCE
jgi:hypothetical protein